MKNSDKGRYHNTPLVSVIMATYNGEAHIREQLDSIINQTYENLEILIQDDGSTDRTLEIIAEYSKLDTRITAIQNASNLGIDRNFIDLIGKAKGELIAISDQDDVWSLNKIISLVMNIGDYSLIYSDSILIDAQGNQIGVTLLDKLGHKPKEGKLLLTLFEENTVSGHACLFRKMRASEFLLNKHEKYDSDYVYDKEIAMIASFKNGIKYHPTPLTWHRIHASNYQNRELTKTKESQKKSAQSYKREICGFTARKIDRVKIKTQRAWGRLHTLETYFNQYTNDECNPFKLIPNAKKRFWYCFYNRKLCWKLQDAGLSKADARQVSRGFLYYLFFKFF